jgi:light-regulated signal transduction histidine kinase (bacteriophytochrome)
MSEPAPVFGGVDLTNCDREPIHIPGSIQSHGVLIVLDPSSLKVIQVAGDTGRLLGLAPHELLGRGLEARIGPAALERLRAFSAQDIATPRPLFAFETGVLYHGHPLEAFVHMSGGALVIELEPCQSEPTANPAAMAQGMIMRVHGESELPGFFQAVATEVRAATGFDRVMVYQFQKDESGAVIAEAKADGLEPYLGLHYPASDIPKQARELFLRNWTRLIPDVRYTPAPITPELNPITGKPLDLTFGVLRSVSPIHVEYLCNMGVAASMSLSLVVEGKLWGLIACHHYKPHRLRQALRSVCDLFAQMISLQLQERLAAKAHSDRLRMKRIHAELVEAMVRENDLGEALIRRHPNLIDYIPAGGAAVLCGGRVTRLGRTPTDEQLCDLVGWLNFSLRDGMFMTDSLGEHFAPAKDYADVASGIIALSASRSPQDYVFWFRPEVLSTVTWAGNPAKAVETGDDGIRLSPRKSFAAWTETVRGRSQPWDDRMAEAARDLLISMLDVVVRHMDQVLREREQARMQQNLLMAELDHRVKNTIATIQALVRFSASGAPSLEAFTRSIQERLHSMARAHSMLTQTRWKGLDLKKVIEEQFAPYGGADRVKISGSKLMLRPKAALSASLALHELTTNAAKYGALSVAEGWVEVGWSEQARDGKPWLALRWAEHGGPVVAPPGRSGFGLMLLERSLAYDVDGHVDLEFRPEGLICKAMIPFEQIIEGEE